MPLQFSSINLSTSIEFALSIWLSKKDSIELHAIVSIEVPCAT